MTGCCSSSRSDLATRADERLYNAKAAGRGRQAGATDWVDLPVEPVRPG